MATNEKLATTESKNILLKMYNKTTITQLYQSYLFICQIIPKISVCVSSYTETICSCVKFEVLFITKAIISHYIYHASTHSVS